MLAVALFFIVILALLAGVALDGTAAFAHAALRASAEHAVAGAVDDAVAQYQRRLAAAIANDPADIALRAPGPFTGAPSAVALLADATAAPPAISGTLGPDRGATPALTIRYRIVPTTQIAPQCGAAGGGRDSVAWLACDRYAQETRISLHVTVQIFDASGDEIAAHDAFVSLRLFAQPPYSAVVGRTDDSAADPAHLAPPALPHEGDVGGDTVSGVRVPAVSPYPAAGSLIHVTYACSPGTLDDGSRVDCALSDPPAPDGNLRYDARWTNGNAP